MKNRLRIGLVGAGAIAKSYASAIDTGSTSQLVAVADADTEAARSLASAGGARVFRSHLELADSGLCDAVVIATPPISHAPVAIDLASRGLPLLCEKPLSVDLDSALHMTRAATENGVLLSMASKFRFVDDIIQARDMVEAGEIGTPLMLENSFTSVVDMTKRWNGVSQISGGGVLIDNGTHSVDIVRYLFGRITEVIAVLGPQIQKIDVEDSVTLFARTAEGTQATIETSWSVHKDRDQFLTIYGTEGAVEVGWKGSRIRRHWTGDWETFGTGYNKIVAFERQIDSFAAVLKGEARPLPTAHDALASVLVIQAAYRSIVRGAWTRVDEHSVPSTVRVAGGA